MKVSIVEVTASDGNSRSAVQIKWGEEVTPVTFLIPKDDGTIGVAGATTLNQYTKGEYWYGTMSTAPDQGAPRHPADVRIITALETPS